MIAYFHICSTVFDGDLEIIVNNIDEDAFIYKNLSIENKLGNSRGNRRGPEKENAPKPTRKPHFEAQ